MKSTNACQIKQVSILIPTYNQQRYISDAIKSALRQSYKNLEIIVGDDCSSDGTQNKLRAFSDSRLKVLRNNTNLGRVGNYRNLLYNHANGDYVVNLDGDDYFTDDDFISCAVEVFERSSDVVIVSARATRLGLRQASVSRQPPVVELSGKQLLARLPSEEYSFQHLATVYRRVDALKANFYSADLLSCDLESLFRLSLRGRVSYLDRCVGVWRIHDSNTSQTAKPADLFDNLQVWPKVFSEARKFGFSYLTSSYYSNRCVAAFGVSSIIEISFVSRRAALMFLIQIFFYYPFAAFIVFVDPRRSCRCLAAFLGLYRKLK